MCMCTYIYTQISVGIDEQLTNRLPSDEQTDPQTRRTIGNSTALRGWSVAFGVLQLARPMSRRSVSSPVLTHVFIRLKEQWKHDSNHVHMGAIVSDWCSSVYNCVILQTDFDEL